MNDPGRYLDNLTARTVGAIAVPALSAQIARTTDPVIRDARSPIDRIRSRIPGLSNDLYPKRNVFGEEVRSEGGVGPDLLSPIWTSTDRHDQTLGLAIDGHPVHRYDEKREARLHDLFQTTTLSNRQIVAETGVALSTVNKSRERFNVALVQAGGELPRCECGQYLHHPRMCWARLHDTMKRSGVASVHTLEPEVKADVHRRLMMSQTARSIAERVGLTKALVQAYLRTLNSDERQQREAAFRTSAGRRRAANAARKIARPHATNPASDPLYSAISAAVPRAIDPALRDDMISQAYLEVLEGRLAMDRLAAGVKKVRGRIFQAFANPWGNLSLDAVLDDGVARRLIERVPADASAFS